jgi:hypothetical protein
VPLLSNSLVALAVYAVATAIAALLVRFRSIQQRALWVVVFAAVVAGFAGVIQHSLAIAGYYACAAASIGIAIWAVLDHRSESRRWLSLASENPIVLRPPFEGRWRVAAGGPDPRYNHHQVARDQYFAYDFLFDDGDSWDRPVLAPCDGLIAYVEDRHDDAPPGSARRDAKHPAGNYVSIETPRGHVILAHLKRGSIELKGGMPVRSGDPVGRCGNSGNTRGAHLHVHAQETPYVDVDAAKGIPIAFAGRDGSKPMLLEYGDRLG